MKRDLVPTAIRTEFGEVLEDASFHDTAGANRDYTYVPGYSDLRRQRDAAIAKEQELHPGRVNWKNVPSLPARLQWVRVTKVVSGQPDNTKEIDAGTNGYRMVKKTDLGEPWFTAMPAGAVERADGSILKGDTVLMVVDQQQAARNAAINQREIQQQTQRVGSNPDVALLETKVADAPVQVRSTRFKSS